MTPFDDSGAFRPTRRRRRAPAPRGPGRRCDGASQSLGFLIQMVATVVLARLLTPADFGLVTMVTHVQPAADELRAERVHRSGPAAGKDRSPARQQRVLDQRRVSGCCSRSRSRCGAPPRAVLRRPAHRGRDESDVGHDSSHQPLGPAPGAAQTGDAIRGRLDERHRGAHRLGGGRRSSWAGRRWGYWALVAAAVALPLATALGAWQRCRWIPGAPGASPRHAADGAVCRADVYGRFMANYRTWNLGNFLLGWHFGPPALGFYKKAYDLFILPLNQLSAPLTNVAVSALSRLRHDPDQTRRAFPERAVDARVRRHGPRRGPDARRPGPDSAPAGTRMGGVRPHLHVLRSRHRDHAALRHPRLDPPFRRPSGSRVPVGTRRARRHGRSLPARASAGGPPASPSPGSPPTGFSRSPRCGTRAARPCFRFGASSTPSGGTSSRRRLRAFATAALLRGAPALLAEPGAAGSAHADRGRPPPCSVRSIWRRDRVAPRVRATPSVSALVRDMLPRQRCRSHRRQVSDENSPEDDGIESAQAVRAFLQAYGTGPVKKRLWDGEFSNGPLGLSRPARPATSSIRSSKSTPATAASWISDAARAAPETSWTRRHMNAMSALISPTWRSRRAQQRSEANGRSDRNRYRQSDILSYVPTSGHSTSSCSWDSIYYVPRRHIPAMLERYAHYLEAGGVFIVRMGTPTNIRTSWR